MAPVPSTLPSAVQRKLLSLAPSTLLPTVSLMLPSVVRSPPLSTVLPVAL
jgi:hypothetical protein